MKLVKLKVTGQHLDKIGNYKLIRDSKNYIKLDFSFLTKDWNNCIKTVVFKTADGKTGSKIMTDNVVKVPVACSASESFTVSVFGVNHETDKRITTNPVEIVLGASGYAEAGEFNKPLPSVYEQILEKLENIGEIDPETVDKAVKEYLENNPIEGVGLTEEQAANLVANTEARHTHSNKVEVLDKFTLDDNGGLLFDGQPIKAESVDGESIDPRVTTAQTVALLLESNGITEVVTETPDVASADGSDFAYKMSELVLGYTLLYVPTEDGVLTYTAPYSDTVEMKVFAGGIYEFKYDVDTWQTSVKPYFGVLVLEFFKSKLLADINIPTKEEIVADVLEALPTWNGGAY